MLSREKWSIARRDDAEGHSCNAFECFFFLPALANRIEKRLPTNVPGPPTKLPPELGSKTQRHCCRPPRSLATWICNLRPQLRESRRDLKHVGFMPRPAGWSRGRSLFLRAPQLEFFRVASHLPR